MSIAIQRARDTEEARLRKELEASKRYYLSYRDHDAEIRYVRAQQALDDHLKERSDR